MIKEHSWLEEGRHRVAGPSGSTHLSSRQADRVGCHIDFCVIMCSGKALNPVQN